MMLLSAGELCLCQPECACHRLGTSPVVPSTVWREATDDFVCYQTKYIQSGGTELWWRKIQHLLQVPSKEFRQLVFKKPELLNGFSKAFFEARWSGWAVGSVCEQFSDWLIGYRVSDVTVNIILSASRSGDYMLMVIKWWMSSIWWWFWHLKNNSGDVY